MKVAYKILAVLIAGGMAGFACLFHAGSLASAPAPATVGNPPPDLPAEAVYFESGSGSRLAGWFVQGQPRRGGVLLMHGIRSNRLEMLDRARMLYAQGFSVLLFDFQAHGESPGRYLTFGYLESRDARAAFDFMRQRLPGEHIGVVGMSLGGAAAILVEKPLEADAMVLEAVFGSFDEALDNRMAMQLGPLGPWLSPLLKYQVEPRLGFDPDILKPAGHVAKVHAPLLLIAGAEDRHASLGEMKRIYATANEPKELWVIPEAPHADFYRFAPEEYERRVLDFLIPRLAADGVPEVASVQSGR
jgi:fermentation-respiration switch protein FrsA (DUF1100 family)